MITLSHILIELRGEILTTNDFFEGVDFQQITDWELIVHFIESYRFSGMRKFEGITSFAILDTFSDENTIDFKHMGRIREIFEGLEQKDGFVYKSELILAFLNDMILEGLMSSVVRKSRLSKKGEKLYEVISRIEKESDDYINYGELEQYFTRRGFPILTLKYKEQSKQQVSVQEEAKVYLFTLPNCKSRVEYLRKIWSQKKFEKVFGK